MKAGIGERVLAASRTRDRVLDAVKAVALLLVIVGHSLAWHVRPDGTAVNVVEDVPYLIALTWLFRGPAPILRGGAVSNAASLSRHGQMDYLRARGRSFAGPVVYASLVDRRATGVPRLRAGARSGRFLSQLLWFAGVYLLAAAARPS